MTKTPTLSPLEAQRRCREKDDFVHEGFRYVLDGPMGCPTEVMAPTASPVDNEEMCWYVNGEPGDDLTEDSYWLVF